MDGKYIIGLIRFAEAHKYEKCGVIEVLDMISIVAAYVNYTVEDYLREFYMK